MIERSDDTTIALDYIKSAIVADCAESFTANDGHVLTDEEMRVVNARLNNDKKHDAHTELLLKLIDHEFDKLRQECKDNDF